MQLWNDFFTSIYCLSYLPWSSYFPPSLSVLKWLVVPISKLSFLLLSSYILVVYKGDMSRTDPYCTRLITNSIARRVAIPNVRSARIFHSRRHVVSDGCFRPHRGPIYHPYTESSLRDTKLWHITFRCLDAATITDGLPLRNEEWM